jgi:hypothetical protein
MKIAVLGAECTGKTQLAQALTPAWVSLIDDANPEDFLTSDSPALMAAIYRDVLFNDSSLYPVALDQHSSYDLTLVMGLDLPWVTGGTQRIGAHSQKSVDARLRELLEANSIRYSVVYGTGTHRTECALQAIAHHMKSQTETQPPAAPSRWQWSCEKCSDSECEHRLFSDLLHGDSLGL